MSRADNIHELADWITNKYLDFIINIIKAIIHPKNDDEQYNRAGSLDFVVESIKNTEIFI